jgi:hypothetical protein
VEGTETSPLEELFASLDRRRRPEDIAQLVLDVLGDRVRPDEFRTIRRAAQGALRHGFYPTSMSEDFARPIGFDHQANAARDLFNTVTMPEPARFRDPEALAQYIAAAGATIAKRDAASDFKIDRLDRSARRVHGLDLSHRQYNKRFRLLARLEQKQRTLAREWQKREAVLVSKSRLASTLKWDEFTADRDSACFIAYYTARCNLRSEFTIYGQERSFDEIAETLLDRCREADSANWWAIAHVFPDREVLAHLSDEQKGALLGRWFGILEHMAALLQEVWERSTINRETMIVRRGNDSTTWNGIAGAWNKARASWVELVYALDMDSVVDALCPGKVLRLMAADVAAWHRQTGGTLDSDTLVWIALPLPWDVLSGRETCTRAMVEAACAQAGVDPIKAGWTAPRPGRRVTRFRPTPELVHGVTVGHPQLALALRKMGVFSGKKIKRPAT